MRHINHKAELQSDPGWYSGRSSRLNRWDLFWITLILAGIAAAVWYSAWNITFSLGVVLTIGVVISLLVARDRSKAGKQLEHAARGGWRVCYRCNYDLGEPAEGEPEPRGDDPVVCPECGTEWTLYRLRDHWHREHLDFVRKTTVLLIRKL